MEAGTARLSACLRWPLLMNDQGQRAAIATGEVQPAQPVIPRRTPARAKALEETTPVLTVKDAVKEFRVHAAAPRSWLWTA